MSQRSTRFVDETDSPWVEHPLLSAFMQDDDPEYKRSRDTIRGWRDGFLFDEDSASVIGYVKPMDLADLDRNEKWVPGVIDHARQLYDGIVKALQEWVIKKGITSDKTGARKQARGAARGYLGNALTTEMIFTASVAQWRWMISQRGVVFADAEIRWLYSAMENSVLSALKQCRYAKYFEDLEIVPAPDGIGTVVQRKATV